MSFEFILGTFPNGRHFLPHF